MTTEEKIDQIHEAVVSIQATMAADKTICASIHKGIDDRISGLHRVVKGNGQPGLEQKHQLLADQFTKLEARVVAWASVAVIVGQILSPVVQDLIKK